MRTGASVARVRAARLGSFLNLRVFPWSSVRSVLKSFAVAKPARTFGKEALDRPAGENRTTPAPGGGRRGRGSAPFPARRRGGAG